MPQTTHIDKSKLNNLLDSKTLLTVRTTSVTVDTTQYIYIGRADPGSDEANPVWLIQRTAINSDESTATLYANGKIAFNQAWTDRATLNYS
ncbi:MAG: hypothetical protein HQL69_06670 [Magnetococcales bacterium]|nr:hypothetical protein [Magnetococcales bacterium]